MSRRRTPAQIQAVLKAVERDLAKGLSVADSCRRHGITDQSYYRWRRLQAGVADDTARQLRDLSGEVERLKQLLAEVMLDNQMLREVEKKSGECRAAASGGGVFAGAVWGVGASGGAGIGSEPIDTALSATAAGRRGEPGGGDASAAASASALRVSADLGAAGGGGLAGQPQAGAAALEGVGSEASDTPETAGKSSLSWVECQQLQRPAGDGNQRCVDGGLYPRPDDEWFFAQVAQCGGRIHPGVVGAGAGGVDERGPGAADDGPVGWSPRSAAGDPLRQRRRVYRRSVGRLVADDRRRVMAGGAGESVAERVGGIISQPAAGRVLELFAVRRRGGRAGSGGLVPS